MHSGELPFNHAHQFLLFGRIWIPGYASSIEMRAIAASFSPLKAYGSTATQIFDSLRHVCGIRGARLAL